MFAPTLFVGAMAGGAIGALAQQYWPLPVSAPSAYVLVGMGTFFAAVFRAPMTSIFMVFEVSANYMIIVPVMLANLVAYLVARKLHPVTFFEMVAAQDGLHLPSHERQRDMRPLRVEDAMRPAPGSLPAAAEPRSDPPRVVYPDESLDAALHRFESHTHLPVVSRENITRVLGELALEDVLKAYGIAPAAAPPSQGQAGRKESEV
jgi:CIC family chloride channel protein